MEPRNLLEHWWKPQGTRIGISDTLIEIRVCNSRDSASQLKFWKLYGILIWNWHEENHTGGTRISLLLHCGWTFRCSHISQALHETCGLAMSPREVCTAAQKSYRGKVLGPERDPCSFSRFPLPSGQIRARLHLHFLLQCILWQGVGSYFTLNKQLLWEERLGAKNKLFWTD